MPRYKPEIGRADKHASNLPMGMISQGNIDLANRPVVHNPDNSVSTELSFSRGENGREVLVPQVVEGKIVSQDAAWQHYHNTGENMGTFSDPGFADSYAIQTHNRPGARLGEKESRNPLYVYPTKPQSVKRDMPAAPEAWQTKLELE